MRRISSNSRNAALAAWAAWDQGRFWEMHDLLLDKAPDLAEAVLYDLARELKLDLEKFKEVMDEQDRLMEGKTPLSQLPHLSELQANLERVHASDIWSTPTVIINGRVIEGEQPYDYYREIIDRALGRKTGDGSGSTAPDVIPGTGAAFDGRTRSVSHRQ